MKTYYAIYRKSPTQENPWNVHLIVITEDPHAVGEFVSPNAQREATSLSLSINRDEEETMSVAYAWYMQRTYLVMKILVVNPYTTPCLYFAKCHESKDVSLLFDKEDVQMWLLENTENSEESYNTFIERMYNLWEDTLTLQQNTLHKISFPILVVT